MKSQVLKQYSKRFIITLLIAFIFVGLINEGAHYLQKEETDRPPEIKKLLIPLGTEKLIKAGEKPPAIPSDLAFVIGDTLLVQNKDSVPHELGPLFIPPGSSASLVMEDANKYTLGCTFQPSRFLDFNVKSRTTGYSRIQALSLATPPTAVFLFIYSILIFPLSIGKSLSKTVDSQENSEL